MDPAVLTPAQQQAYDGLFAPHEPRPHFDPDLVHDLRADLEVGVAPHAEQLLPAELVVHKASLARVHQCERHHLAVTAEPFAWSVSSARGVVAHRAVELSVFMTGSPAPGDVVDLAIERILDVGDEWSPRSYLLDAPPVEVAELRAEVTEWVTKFTECFPPLKKAWLPRLESPLRVELCAGRIVLRAKPDLALGRARGDQAGVLIVDFKSGRPRPGHLDDLRFYALVEALRIGTPPFRVASYYLESARWYHEDVDEGTLRATVRRVVEGVAKLAALRLDSRPPTETPGPACSYCPLAHRCEGARVWDEQREALGMEA